MDKVIDSVEVRQGQILTIKRKYGSGDVSDNKDESNVWLQVIKSNNPNIKEGDLVKASTRHTIEHEIEKEFYYEADGLMIGLIIKKENVKESLFTDRRSPGSN